ncbi:MAG: hypothetical protein AAF490_04090 [Chloroflexota bacterium]
MNLSASDNYVQKPNRFPWRHFVGYTAVILIVVVLSRLIPDYLFNQYLYVQNGEFALELEKNLQEALAVNPPINGEINAEALAPNIVFHCGDFFGPDMFETPINLQTCQTESGYISLQNINENVLLYRFNTVMIFDGAEPTFAAELGQTGPTTPFSQQLLINGYLEGSLDESTWHIDGMDSSLLVPIFDESETAVIGAIFVEMPPPTGFLTPSFLLQISTFYLPLALIIAFAVVHLTKSKRKANQ